jgi:hypothetical protein
MQRACIDGRCGVEPAPDGTPLADEAGDCLANVCVGGAPGTIEDLRDIETDGNPCTEHACTEDGPVTTPSAAGSVGTPEGGGCAGRCQGGAYLGTCGQRVHSRVFPGPGSWSADIASNVFTGANAPPPTGIVEAEHAVGQNRLLVWRSDGTFYQRRDGAWDAPIATSAKFESFPPGANVAMALAWRDTIADSIETLLITSDESPPRAWIYDLMPTGGTIFLSDGPLAIQDAQSSDPEAPPQHTTPYSWGFAEVRGQLGGSLDWVVMWEGLGGSVYEYWGGSNDFVSNWPDASSPLGLDGSGNAPAAGSVAAAWYTGGTVFMVAP